MNILIIKLGATGDVVRTTPLLSKLDGQITWLTDARNVPLLQDLGERLPRNNSAHGAPESLDGRRSFPSPPRERAGKRRKFTPSHAMFQDRRPFTPWHAPSLGKVLGLSWDERTLVPDVNFDLVINLEDSLEFGAYLRGLRFRGLFGAFLDADGSLRYTEDSRPWFDLSLISRHGRQQADRLKLLNRRSYQDLIFEGLGFRFSGEEHLLPEPTETDLRGDVAIAPVAHEELGLLRGTSGETRSRGPAGQRPPPSLVVARTSGRPGPAPRAGGGDSLPMLSGPRRRHALCHHLQLHQPV
jgi:hypothetical protein